MFVNGSLLLHSQSTTQTLLVSHPESEEPEAVREGGGVRVVFECGEGQEAGGAVRWMVCSACSSLDQYFSWRASPLHRQAGGGLLRRGSVLGRRGTGKNLCAMRFREADASASELVGSISAWLISTVHTAMWGDGGFSRLTPSATSHRDVEHLNATSFSDCCC